MELILHSLLGQSAVNKLQASEIHLSFYIS